ncbi:MAG: hypothetical protein NZ952_03850 [Candidatus Bathyarchaeota archaeon]|nr:hypothetical protein [Candidatus Bathyarchaeota archaeon]
MIIATEDYDADSIREILRIRAREEKVTIENDALERLTQIGAKSSLRYAVQLLSLAAQNAKVMKHETVKLEDVERVDSLFMDTYKASEHLRKYEDRLLYH